MGNPILDPILNFFQSIWSGLTNLWNGLVNAIVHWIQTVWSYTYMGIPVGPLMFIGIGALAFFMIWGIRKLKEYF